MRSDGGRARSATTRVGFGPKNEVVVEVAGLTPFLAEADSRRPRRRGPSGSRKTHTSFPKKARPPQGSPGSGAPDGPLQPWESPPSTRLQRSRLSRVVCRPLKIFKGLNFAAPPRSRSGTATILLRYACLAGILFTGLHLLFILPMAIYSKVVTQKLSGHEGIPSFPDAAESFGQSTGPDSAAEGGK